MVPEEEAGEVFEGRVRESWQEGGDAPGAEIERPKIKFDDVGGMEALKEEIGMKIIYPLQHPEMYRAYGKEIGGGILMYGPPGCGKTYLARATAGEIRAGFISVGINDVLEMWMGNSERNLHSLFEQARYNRPCVVFFDEVDALGGRRADMTSGSGRQVINQFLAKKADHFSGADLKAVVDVAVEQKIREAMKAGVPKPIGGKDLLAAIKRLKPTTREWFATARNYALYSNQGGMYDDVLKFLKLS